MSARAGRTATNCNVSDAAGVRPRATAIKAGVPIIPVSIIGAEEIYPMVANIKPLARALGFPYFPITPFFPLFGLLGLTPVPEQMDHRVR